MMTQQEYIAILFRDCGYDTSAQRKGWLQKRFEKSFTDELTSAERSLAIVQLKDEKAPKYSLDPPFDSPEVAG